MSEQHVRSQDAVEEGQRAEQEAAERGWQAEQALTEIREECKEAHEQLAAMQVCLRAVELFDLCKDLRDLLKVFTKLKSGMQAGMLN
eukprot:1158535-Pelagomonas_calceolata.AAC.11